MKNILSTATICLAVHSVTADAANLQRDKVLVQEVIELAYAGRQGPPGSQLYRMEQNLSVVRNDIFDLRHSQDKLSLEMSLDRALYALRSRGMSIPAILNTVVSESQTSLSIIDRLIYQESSSGTSIIMNNAIQFLERSKVAALQSQPWIAQDHLNLARSELSRLQALRDYLIDRALMEMSQASTVLNDRYLDPRRKLSEFQRLVDSAIFSIRSSPNYRNGQDSVDRVKLGETRQFSNRRSSTETIFVSQNMGTFDTIALIARHARIHVEMVEVTFGNGRSQMFYLNQRLEANLPLNLALNGRNGRFIQSIRITAQTMDAARLGTIVVRGVAR